MLGDINEAHKKYQKHHNIHPNRNELSIIITLQTCFITRFQEFEEEAITLPEVLTEFDILLPELSEPR